MRKAWAAVCRRLVKMEACLCHLMDIRQMTEKLICCMVAEPNRDRLCPQLSVAVKVNNICGLETRSFLYEYLNHATFYNHVLLITMQ